MSLIPRGTVPGRIITVGGGKGGVGKSVVSANLAIGMAEQGHSVILVDGDLGAANLHTHFGLVRSGRGLASFITHEVETLPELLLPTFKSKLKLLPGAGAVPGAANLGYGQKRRLFRHLRALQCDVLVIDVGAGSSFNVVDLFSLGDLRLLVSTPQLTSLQNAYAFAKACAWRTLHTLLKSQGVHKSPLRITASETETVASFLERVSMGEPEMALRCSMALQHFGAFILGNQIFAPQEGRALHALARMLNDFLGIEATVLGLLRARRSMHDSVGRRLPYLADAGPEQNALVLREAAQLLLDHDVEGLREGREQAKEVDPAERDQPLPGDQGADPKSSIEDYMARSTRVEVRWHAVLTHQEREQEVTIRDISEGGARLQLHPLPQDGARCTLRIDSLSGEPSLQAKACNLAPDQSECGLRFLESPRQGARLVAMARAKQEAQTTPSAANKTTATG